jgi:hypothetical protein
MSTIDEIVAAVAANFSSFGGKSITPCNPISAALKDKPPMFAMGVDIEDVVRFVMDALEEKP